jgi:hypothetical protein
MDLTSIGVSAGALVAGMSAGGFAGWLARARKSGRGEEHRAFPMHPDLARTIDAEAAAWAEAHGRPELSGLLARKVKLGYRAKYGDDPWVW